MELLDLTLATPAENLALDEALLEEAEAGPGPREVLRLWESPEPVVVVGRSTRLEDEVHLDACQRDGVPVLRRCSGGAAIVAGPGCLMYAVVLSYERHPGLRLVDQAHDWVLGKVAAALRSLAQEVAHSGTSDLTRDNRKVSGNSLRCKRTHLLYHGTLLYDFPLPMLAKYLRSPPRQPDYRAGRAHEQFVANLSVPASAMRAALQSVWEAHPTKHWPRELVRQLVASRYSLPQWNAQR